MKKIAYILVLSLLLLNVSCSQQSNENRTPQGYGANQSTNEDDAQTGAGQVDNSELGPAANANGGSMNNTTATDDTLHTPDRVGETQATSATEKTQKAVGNAETRGDENHSKSRTTKNKVVQ